MKVRLALLSSRGASGSVDALAETSPVGAPGINATIFHSGLVTARLRIAGTTESKRLTMAEFSPSLCLGGINLLHTAPDRETTAPPFEDGAATPGPMTLASARPGLSFRMQVRVLLPYATPTIDHRMVAAVRETLVFQAERFFTPEERQQFSAWLSSMAFRDRCQLLDELVEMNRTVLVWVAPFDADNLIDDLVSGYAAQLDHLAAA